VLAAVTSWVVLQGSFFLLKLAWPEYALAYPTRAYTVPMLLVRLVVFAAMIGATSVVATRVSRESVMPWGTGLIVLAVSIPDHLYPGYLWDAFPAWYHLSYLASILPVAVFAGRVFGVHEGPR